MISRSALGIAALLALLTVPALRAAVKDHRSIEYPPLPEFKIEKPQVLELGNGMTVFLMEDHELPLIRVYARIRGGANRDPRAKTGLGNIFGQALREGGTTTMSGDEMDDFLAARAASIESGMSGDYGVASMNCLEQDFDEVFALFVDMLRRPAFAEDKVELAKLQANTGIARRNDSISGITGREFRRLIYGQDSPLSRLTEYRTIAEISRDDLLAWHKRNHHPNNVYLGIVGDFDAKAMQRKISERLGDWERGADADRSEIAYESAMEPGIYFIEKSDVTQAYVRLGHLGMRVGHPDYFAAQVMNEVLGGSFSSRLFSNVRSKKGLAYSVFGRLGASFLRPGVFQVGLSTKSGTMAQSIDALREEIDRIINDPPSDAEIQRAKEAILNSFVFNYDSKGEVLAQQMRYAFYGLPADFLEQYRDRIDAVTRADVARVAKEQLHPNRLKLLVVGKSADFDRPVDSLGTVKRLDISIPPLAVPTPN